MMPDYLDPSGVKLTPSYHGQECLGNGRWIGYECCCDECDFYLECFPDAEDEAFADLMERVADARGEQLQAEAERLNADPAAAVPEELTQRVLADIDRAFEKT